MTAMHEGTITTVVLGRGFGFIARVGEPDIFFHASNLADGLEFNERLQELRVRFDIIGTERGPAAKNVRLAI